MASATVLRFDTHPPAAFAIPSLTNESAEHASRVLQDNHDKYDITYNADGFHNHIAHHVCTAFALGATPSAMQAHYENNLPRQRARAPEDLKTTQELHDPKAFMQYMGSFAHYSPFLSLFTEEIRQKGWQQVLQEYVFKGDERANVVFNRLYAGYYHPIIHLGFGIEFEQPAIIAEALAQACIHPGWLDTYFDELDSYVKEKKPARKPFLQIITDIKADRKLSEAAHWNDKHLVRDGIMVRAKEEMIRHAAAWQVDVDSLEEATADMINGCAYFSGAAQRRDKQINFDFFYIHAFNPSIFFPVFLRQTWLSAANKVRLLEWKGRMDACLYASRRSPDLHLDEITDYKPHHPGQSSWDEVFKRAAVFDDDGHACKYVRTLAMGERFCKPYEGRDDFMIKDASWLQLANMLMDSVEDTNATWIRSAGFDEAWEDVKPR